MTTDVADAVLDLARGPLMSGDPFARPQFQALFREARGVAQERRDALLATLAPGLDVADPFHAACIALSCGTLVEYGASPGIVGMAILQAFDRALHGAGTVDGRAFGYFALAAMAHLARDASLRVRARGLASLREGLKSAEEVEPKIGFVQRALALVDDQEVLVLAPAESRGYVVRLEGIQSNFHLFTLLQGELIGDPEAGWLPGKSVPSEVLDIARGTVAHAKVVTDEQRFHFHNWSVIAKDGTLQDDLRSTLWGEGSPRDIPLHEGRAVVVLGRPILGGRSWDSNFFANFHDALRSSVRVEAKLSTDEAKRALASLAARAAVLGTLG